MNAAVELLTPAIGFTAEGTSWTYTPGCRYCGIGNLHVGTHVTYPSSKLMKSGQTCDVGCHHINAFSPALTGLKPRNPWKTTRRLTGTSFGVWCRGPGTALQRTG